MNTQKILDTVLVPVNRAGWPFIAAFAVISLLLALLAPPLGWVGAVLTAWCIYFFRDPERMTPARAGLVVSPADGMVEMIAEAPPPPELGMGPAPRTRISVFLSIFDVHVNRIPVDGVVTGLSYRPGKFFDASLDKASEHNERQSIRITTPDGEDFAVVQIAGLVARRIVCELRDSQPVRAGERFGLIRFGSRLDVYLPPGVPPLVAVGQRAIAGETVIADRFAQEPAREGEVR